MEDHEITTGALEWDYIPEWKGNDKKENPIVAHLRLLTTRETNRCINITGTGPDINKEKVFEYGVVSISGLKAGDKELTTAKQVLDTAGYYGLFQELWIEILHRNNLAEQDSKN